MAKKAKASDADEILRMMYPDLPTSEDDDPEFKTKADDTDKVSALEAKIAALEAAASGRSTPTSTPAPQRAMDTPPMRPVVDYSKAPDPIQDPQGYAAFVHKATQDEIRYEKEAIVWQNKVREEQSGRVNSLWSSFREAHKDYAKDEDRVEVAAGRVIQRAQAAGVDTNKYMFEQSDKFMADIVKEIDKLWPGQSAASGDDDDDDDDDALEAVPGGQVGARQPAARKNPAPSKYGDLGTELRAWQQKTGFVH